MSANAVNALLTAVVVAMGAALYQSLTDRIDTDTQLATTKSELRSCLRGKR